MLCVPLDVMAPQLMVPTVMFGVPVRLPAVVAVAALPVHEPELPVTLPVKVDAVELAKDVQDTVPPL